MSGWISLHRELLDKAIWLESTPEQKTILITLLLMANHKEKEWEWKGERYKAKPGQFVTSLKSIVEKCGIGVTIQNVRTALKRFEKYEFLTNETTNKNRLITIVNWEHYQSDDGQANKQTNKQLTSNQQAINKQLTTNNNDNNDNNIYTIFEHWCSQGIIAHKKLNDKMRSHINARLQEHSVDELLKAVDNYKEVLTNDKYYWTHKWTLQDFMKPNNVVRFLDDSNPFQSFLKNKSDNVVHLEKQQPQGRYIPSGFDYEAAKSAGEDPDWWRQ